MKIVILQLINYCPMSKQACNSTMLKFKDSFFSFLSFFLTQLRISAYKLDKCWQILLPYYSKGHEIYSINSFVILLMKMKHHFLLVCPLYKQLKGKYCSLFLLHVYLIKFIIQQMLNQQEFIF